MSIEEILKNSNLNKDNISYNEQMSKHTSFKIGGLAECFIKIENIEQLKQILHISNTHNIPLTIVGNGTNLLVKDGGIKGIVLKIDIKNIDIDKQNKIIKVGSGNLITKVAQELMQNELSGFEELSGIPGTIGGAIRMNAGAHGKEIKDIVTKVCAIDFSGDIHEFTNEQMKFEYRNSIFSNNKYIILDAQLKLDYGEKTEIQKKMQEYAVWRKEHQPLEFPNAGSTFKRGEDFITAKLIDECGLKGYKIGGAEISTKHAGFIINSGNATAKDVLDLIKYTKKQVYEKFRKEIKLEIEVIGEE